MYRCLWTNQQEPKQLLTNSRLTMDAVDVISDWTSNKACWCVGTTHPTGAARGKHANRNGAFGQIINRMFFLSRQGIPKIDLT